MRPQIVFSFVLIAQACFTPAAAGTVTWACSVIEDGKPEVIKYTVEKNYVVVSDPMSRIIKWADRKFGTGAGGFEGTRLKVVEDNAKGLIAVGEGTATGQGEPSNYSTRTLIINKHTGALSYTLLSTLNGPVETKGTCTD